ncbi:MULTISPECIES: hypothetical protein [unclassified Streptomyces]|nr:hypothetical protein [Streptomyces sp. NBC_00370]
MSAAPTERGAVIRIRLRISLVDWLAVIVLIVSTTIVITIVNRH